MKPTIPLLVLLATGLPATTPAGTDLEAWLADHAPAADQVISFTETRASELVAGEVITRGTLRFEPPDRLEKHITAPREETHVITAERVIIDRGQRQRDFSLDRAPALAALRQALLGWLTADAASLEKHFEVELDDRDGAWTLILRPRSGDLADELDRLVLSGDNDTAHRLETHLADGEVITTRFEPDA